MISDRSRRAFSKEQNRLHWGHSGWFAAAFPAALGRRGFGMGRSVVPGFFRIAKSVFSKIASRFGGWKID